MPAERRRRRAREYNGKVCRARGARRCGHRLIDDDRCIREHPCIRESRAAGPSPASNDHLSRSRIKAHRVGPAGRRGTCNYCRLPTRTSPKVRICKQRRAITAGEHYAAHRRVKVRRGIIPCRRTARRHLRPRDSIPCPRIAHEPTNRKAPKEQHSTLGCIKGHGVAQSWRWPGRSYQAPRSACPLPSIAQQSAAGVHATEHYRSAANRVEGHHMGEPRAGPSHRQFGPGAPVPFPSIGGGGIRVRRQGRTGRKPGATCNRQVFGTGPSTLLKRKPLQGFEPWTYALRKHRSTAELKWRKPNYRHLRGDCPLSGASGLRIAKVTRRSAPRWPSPRPERRAPRGSCL